MKHIITSALLLVFSVCAMAKEPPAGYIYLTTQTGNGIPVYMTAPLPTNYTDGRKDELYEYSTWAEDVGFFQSVANCKTAGLVMDIGVNNRGNRYTTNPRLYSPGQIAYAAWERACVKR